MKSIKNALIFLYQKIVEELLDLLYPKTCIICGKENKDILCDTCFEKRFFNKVENECRIENYNNKNKSFNEHLYLFKYEKEIRSIILDYKFNDKAYLRDFFVKIILKNEKICRKIKKYDIMIPVPIHKKRKSQRGYDQSELIAKKLVKSFDNLELITNCLVKQKHTIKQSALSKNERKQNVIGVYKLKNKEKISNKRIILFDDIFTTGSTTNECAKILKENGVSKVLVFTIAKD